MKVAFIIILIFFNLSLAMAQDTAPAPVTITDAKQADTNKKLKDGWHPKLKIKTNLSLGSSQSVIGQTDGDSKTLGASIDAGLDFKSGRNEWRQELKFSGATTSTPTLPRFVKSSDELGYSTIYLRSLASYPHVGPYARAEAKTSAFKGENVTAQAKTYLYKLNETTNINLGSYEVFRLTDPFVPLTTKEAMGFFYKAIERENTSLEFRLGYGAIQVKTKDQYRLDDDSNTVNVIEVTSLESASQSGVEYGFVFKGKWNETSEYSFVGDFLTPLGVEIDSGKECEDCSTLELTNIDLKFSLTSKVNSWATVSYEYKALKQPEVLDQFQIQHGLVLNFIYDVF
ncbi:MAG: hypothetical protein KDD58_05125 [Bdellovibrionales bacterium]|nr:hypothetical protein [Bdellovibrionales bacterium]